MPPKTYPVRNSFNSGEVSPLVDFRDDVAKYNSACLTLENVMPLVEGGAKKMPGTYFAGATALGGSSFTGSISGTTMTVTAISYGTIRVGQSIIGASTGTVVTAFGSGTGGTGTYTVNNSQTLSSTILMTAASGRSRLVPFQFSTSQGAVLEISAGIIRVWEAATPGSRALGIALGSPSTSNYNPATAYVPGNSLKVGPFIQFPNLSNSSGRLIVSAPNTQANAISVQVSVSINSSDALSVSIYGSSPNQGISIALANATASHNAASLIQTAIRALGALNSPASNYIDLSGWTVTPDPTYFASPWISLPVGSFTGNLWPSASFGTDFSNVVCGVANQNDVFPLVASWTPLHPSGFLFSLNYNSPQWAQNTNTFPPIEITVPYAESDLFSLDCSTQSADVLWIFHPAYPPAVIERLGANQWQYSLALPGTNPSFPAYRGTTDIVKTGYSALGQCISAITQANPGVVTVSSTNKAFSQGDLIYINLVGGMVELNEGQYFVDNPGFDANGNQTFSLKDVNTGTDVNTTGFVKYVSGGFAVKVVPLFAAAGDYPSCGTLYQERLVMAGSINNPTQVNGSVQGDYPDFIADPNEDDFAVQFTLVSNKLDQILSVIGTPNALVLGTAGGVWIMNGSNGGALTQTNVNASKQTTVGVGNQQPQLVNDAAIFISRSSRIVLFLVFNFVSNQWDNYDLTRLNRQITLGPTQATSGISQTGFQIEPYPIFWAVRNDGQLIGLVFNRQDQVYAWFRVNMTTEGGAAATTRNGLTVSGGLVESVAVITGQGIEDQVVVEVNRSINGVMQRYVEYFMPQEMFSQLSNAFFVHCGQQLTLAGPFNITGINQGSPCIVTAPGHTFTNGMTVQVANVQGMVEINQDKTQAYTVTGVSGNTFQLSGMDSSAFHAYSGGGTVMQATNQVTGMSYLMGQQVEAVGDGAKILAPTPVTSDQITFPYYCNQITIGIPYGLAIQPTNPVLATQGGTTRGMKQKLSSVTLSLYESMGGQYGTDLNHMYDIDYGTGSMAQAPSMSSAEFTRDLDADWSRKSTFFITQNEPFPFTLRGLVMTMSFNQD